MDKKMNQNLGNTSGANQNKDFNTKIGKTGGSSLGKVSGQGVGNQDNINR